MDTIIMWVTIFGILVIPVVGWIFKFVIEKRQDSLSTQQDRDRELFFKKFDEVKELYVRKDIYEQAMTYHQKETDVKFENMLGRMSDQFKTVEDKIEDLKSLIIKNFNTQQGNTSR